MASLSIDKASTIRQWLFDNYSNRWTIDQVNSMFKSDLSARQLYQIYRGQYVLNLPQFSFFRAPVTNTKPAREINLVQLFQAISGTHYKALTEQFRAMPKSPEKDKFKRTNFDYITGSGTFSSREASGLITPSYYGVFDVDKIQEPEVLKNLLIADPVLNPDLIFVSPSGNGLKFFVSNTDGADYAIFYDTVIKYLRNKYPDYAIAIDKSTRDICRACFLCYDPQCYLTPKLKILCQQSKN